MNEVRNHWKKWLYWFFLGVAIIVVYKTLDNFNDIAGVVGRFFDIITPFLVAIFIAYLLYMPCKKIEEWYRKSKVKVIKKRARGLSVLTVYIIILVAIMILINVILPIVSDSIIDFFGNIQGYLENSIRKYNALPEDSWLKGDLVKEAVENIQNIEIKQYIHWDKIVKYVVNAISAVTSVFRVFVAIIVSVYILLQRTRILNFFKRFANALFKERTYKNIDRYFNDSNEIFFKFIASQFLDAIIVGILVTIAMSIIGIKYAPFLGFFIGIFNMIPYIGAIIATLISALVTLITGGLTQTIWMIIVVIVLQQIDANVISPRIIGKSLKISPILVIFSVTVGGAYFGVIGMFLAVPIMAVIKILLEDYISYKLAIKEEKRKLEELQKEIEGQFELKMSNEDR